MATTTGGTTYVTSTDLVANYPTSSLSLANRVDVVASGSMSKKTASYTVTVADILAGTTIAMNSASATVITLPSTSLVNGMTLNVFSVNTGAVTFTGGTVTGTTTSITAQYSGLSLTYDSAAAVWWSLPFAGGSAKPTVTGTTGSPTITTVGSNTVYKFTGTGSITFGTAGTVNVLIIAGGGAGGYFSIGSGGGGGGFLEQTMSVGAVAHTVQIGAGGVGQGTASAMSTSGGDSWIRPSSGIGGLTSVGGGRGGGYGDVNGGNGGSGGGAASGGAAGSTLYNQGFSSNGSAGVGGAGAGGTNTLAVGGVGRASSITGSAVTYSAGGNGASGGAGAANTGNGGAQNAGGFSGGSGVVIISV